MEILLIVALVLAIIAGIAALTPPEYARFSVLLVAIAVGLVIITLL